MDCPRCHMPLDATEYEGVEVEVCPSCWGFWLDRGELAEIVGRRKLAFSEAERRQVLDVRRAWDKGPETPAGCPRCGQTMERVHYDASVHLVVDRCADHGTWLDTGELKKVQAIAEKSQAIHRMLIAKLGL